MNTWCKRIIFILISLNLVTLIAHIYEPKVVETEFVKMTRYVYVEVEPDFYYDVSSVEREMLARLLHTEARGESSECQIAIISVVFNRVESTGMSISDVINSEGQFDLAGYLYKVTPTEKEYESVDYVIENGPTIPSWVQYFRADYHHNWSSDYVPYCVIDNTYFGGIK